MDNNLSEPENTEQNNQNIGGLRVKWLAGVGRQFSRIGLAYFVFFIVYYGMQACMSVVAAYLIKKGLFGVNKEIISFASLALSMIPTYIVSLPILQFMLRKIRPTVPKQAHMTGKGLAATVVIVFFLMYAGNIAGRILMSFISTTSGTNMVNSIDQLTTDSTILSVLILAVIIAPVFEEICFRKLLLDRTAVFGERNAMILSGLTFGLFHANLYQFFYAFFIGLVFAYIYIRTGKIRYSIGLHTTVNFFGSVVPMILLKNIDINKLTSNDPKAIIQLIQTPGFMKFFMYAVCLFIAVFAGFIMFLAVMSNHSVSLDAEGAPMTKEESIRITYKNVGMILFVIATIGVTVLIMVAEGMGYTG